MLDQTSQAPVSKPPPGKPWWGTCAAGSRAMPLSAQNGARPATHRLPCGSKVITRSSSPGMPVVEGLTMFQCGACAKELAATAAETKREANRRGITESFMGGIVRKTVHRTERGLQSLHQCNRGPLD